MKTNDASRNEERFRAPWSPALIVITVAVSALLLGVSVVTMAHQRTFWAAVLPMGIFVGALLSTVRGYEVTPKHIAVKRLIWSTYIGRHGLKEVRILEGGGIGGGWRLFGNGGLFGFTGVFWSGKLGRYRAYATGGKRAVLLEYQDRKIVLTPDDPERFVAALSRQ